MPVWAVLEFTPSSELTEWLAFSELEPFGGMVEDLRAGLSAAATVNVNRGPDGQPMGPLDPYPWHKKQQRTPKLDPDEPGISYQERARRLILMEAE